MIIEIVKMILSETADLCLGLAGFLFLMTVGCCLRMIWERMVKFVEDRIAKIRKTKAVCK